MNNILLYQIVQKKNYNLENLVKSIQCFTQDESQGILVHEYNLLFIRATYWKKNIRKEQRYNLATQNFELFEEEIINVVDFWIDIQEHKLMIFGSKQMAQRIITLLSILSNNSYIITEYILNMQELVEKICHKSHYKLLSMKLKDIFIEKSVLVNCTINLTLSDNPQYLVLKYINNISQITFKINNIFPSISLFKSGKISISKFEDEEKYEVIDEIINIIS